LDQRGEITMETQKIKKNNYWGGGTYGGWGSPTEEKKNRIKRSYVHNCLQLCFVESEDN